MDRRAHSAFVLSMAAWLGASASVAAHKSPTDLALSPAGDRLYVACHTANVVAVLDVKTGKKLSEIKVGAGPMGLVMSPDGKALFVACAEDNTVQAVDVVKDKPGQTVRVGSYPANMALAKDGKLYVCNRDSHDLSIVDTKTMKEVRRIGAIREPAFAALTPDGAKLVVTNRFPLGPSTNPQLAAHVSVFDLKTLKATPVKLVIGATDVQGVCCSPDGKWAYVVHTLSRYNVPTTQLDRGWMNNAGLSIIDLTSCKRLGTLLLDEVNMGYANPHTIIASADGKKLYIGHAGVHVVSEIDVAKVHKIFADTPADKHERLADDLSLLIRHDAVRRLRVKGIAPKDLILKPHIDIIQVVSGLGPRGIALSKDGKAVFTANYYSDDVTVIDLARGRAAAVLRLGPRAKPDQVRLGEMLFYDATVCFQHWQSCGSCHPDGRADALNWDLLNDGIGNPKNTRSLVLSHKTPPVMSLGVRANMEVASLAGFRFILFREPEDGEVDAVVAYIKSMKPRPSPRLKPDGKLSDAAKRGKALFESNKTKCATCHPAPLYTDLRVYDVGTKGELDRKAEFDTPTLLEIWRTGPYLHDGAAVTIHEVLKKCNKGDTHGVTSHLTDKELADLAEFLLSL